MIENLKKYSPYILVLLVVANVIYFLAKPNNAAPVEPAPTGAVIVIVVSPTPDGKARTLPTVTPAANVEQPVAQASPTPAPVRAIATAYLAQAQQPEAAPNTGSSNNSTAGGSTGAGASAPVPTATTFFYSKPVIEPTQTNVPTPVGQPQIVGVPGITLTQLNTKLSSEKGYTCNLDSSKTIKDMECKLQVKSGKRITEYTVHGYGRDTKQTLFIYTTVSQGAATEADITAMFSYIAALPFSDPAVAGQAKNWIANGMPSLLYAPHHDISIVIGGINFRLYGEAPRWFFEMGDSLLLE